MRVLVTRPEVSAAKTAGRIRALGHEPVLLPLFAPEHDPAAVREALAGKPSGLILTSAEAARSLQKADVADAATLTLPVFAVGDATAEAARTAGFGKIHVSGGNGEALAGEIAARIGSACGTLLYLAGEPRSAGLERVLAERNVPFRTVTAYRMRPVEHRREEIDTIFGTGAPDAVLLYSREAALRFSDLFGDREQTFGARGLILCLSPAIAAALPPHLAPSCLSADAPREDRLLALLPPARSPDGDS